MLAKTLAGASPDEFKLIKAIAKTLADDGSGRLLKILNEHLQFWRKCLNPTKKTTAEKAAVTGETDVRELFERGRGLIRERA